MENWGYLQSADKSTFLSSAFALSHACSGAVSHFTYKLKLYTNNAALKTVHL